VYNYKIASQSTRRIALSYGVKFFRCPEPFMRDSEVRSNGRTDGRILTDRHSHAALN